MFLAGVYIPRKGEVNYIPALEDNIKKILLDKKFKFKKVLNKNIRYPKYDLVNVYDESGKCINGELLKTGQAFFDQGFYTGKDLYEKLEQEAKKQNLGIWKNKEKLKLLFATSKNWWGFHYPECPEVQKIKPKDRTDFYFYLTSIFYHRYPEFDCKYCKEIEKKFNRPKLFTYEEKDYIEDIKKEKEKK